MLPKKTTQPKRERPAGTHKSRESDRVPTCSELLKLPKQEPGSLLKRKPAQNLGFSGISQSLSTCLIPSIASSPQGVWARGRGGDVCTGPASRHHKHACHGKMCRHVGVCSRGSEQTPDNSVPSPTDTKNSSPPGTMSGVLCIPWRFLENAAFLIEFHYQNWYHIRKAWCSCKTNHIFLDKGP